jgi:hypothetical protein
MLSQTWGAVYHGPGLVTGQGAKMAAHKRTEITIETDRIMIIRRRNSKRLWCAECGGEADMASLEQAGIVTGLAGKPLRDYAQARGWHISGQEGSLLICLESLLKSM